MRRSVVWVPLRLALATWCFTAACGGSVNSEGGEPDDAEDGEGGEGGNAEGGSGGARPPRGGQGGQIAPDLDTAVGPLALRRLSRREYDNTVRDLLGDDRRPASAFAAEYQKSFRFARPSNVAVEDARALRDAAEALAAQAVKNLGKLLPCSPTAATEADCARRSIEALGARAYRRPLLAAESTRLFGLYERARSTLKLAFADAMGIVIEAMLQSPAFLYHWELEDARRDGALVKLGPYQLASRLSYLVWGTMPDAELFAAAKAGTLDTDQQIEAQVERMRKSPKSADAAIAFFEDWLGVHGVAEASKDATVYPLWNDALKSAMGGEVAAFIGAATSAGDPSLAELLGATHAFVNEPLARVYGLASIKGASMQRAELDPKQRRGLLTLASFLAQNAATDGSHPVRRGHVLYEYVLCHELPPPPPDVPPAEPASKSGKTTRERFDVHASNPCAKACHGRLDPLGFAFEHYDGIGAWRTTDAGKPVDASAKVSIDDKEHTVDGAPALARVLAASREANDCLARQWFRSAMGRREVEEEEPAIAALGAQLREGGGRLSSLLRGIATSPAFRRRIPANGEVLP